MKFTEGHTDGIRIVKPAHPRLDASTAPALREVLIDRISNGDQNIVLDLADVTFMDSSALGALIAAAKRMGPTGTIAVAGLAPPVAKLFSVTRMDRVFSMNASVHEAVRKLTS